MTKFKKTLPLTRERVIANLDFMLREAGIDVRESEVRYNTPEMWKQVSERLSPDDLETFEFYSWLNVWHTQRRPYLNVWPVVLQCLENTRLDVTPGQLPETEIDNLGIIEIRLPAQHEVGSFFLAKRDPTVNAPGDLQTFCLYEMSGVNHFGLLSSRCSQNSTFQEVADRLVDTVGVAPPKDEYNEKIDRKMLAIAAGVCLLAADDRYIDPVLLNRDRNRDLDEEAHQRAVKRAKNRGEFGFDLGKTIEVSPHFRRPHFGIRLTGKGRRIAKLVPIKGAIINRELLGDIPTGYQDDEELKDSEDNTEE